MSSGLQIRIVFFTSIMPISSPNPMFDHLLESSHRDDSNKWSNIGFSEEFTQVELIEVNFIGLICCPVSSFALQLENRSLPKAGVLLAACIVFLLSFHQNWPHPQSPLPGNTLPGCSVA